MLLVIAIIGDAGDRLRDILLSLSSDEPTHPPSPTPNQAISPNHTGSDSRAASFVRRPHTHEHTPVRASTTAPCRTSALARSS